MNMTVAD